ncbi:hypothetical protein BC834DRAFT_246514 [Gloeopeniophorella convolvens]|nr:hypothetical protein BC834DRAFT_246514 [Gloeopeniophorella convolvens]
MRPLAARSHLLLHRTPVLRVPAPRLPAPCLPVLRRPALRRLARRHLARHCLALRRLPSRLPRLQPLPIPAPHSRPRVRVPPRLHLRIRLRALPRPVPRLRVPPHPRESCVYLFPCVCSGIHHACIMIITPILLGLFAHHAPQPLVPILELVLILNNNNNLRLCELRIFYLIFFIYAFIFLHVIITCFFLCIFHPYFFIHTIVHFHLDVIVIIILFITFTLCIDTLIYVCGVFVDCTNNIRRNVGFDPQQPSDHSQHLASFKFAHNSFHHLHLLHDI